MHFDDSTPIGPAECPNCPGQHHWPHQCQNTPEQQRERQQELDRLVAQIRSERARPGDGLALDAVKP